ncbi:unnamed protein product [Didymodactylos carnosus]|uniref:Uncharacterized protein n=1 Tax=Didymodactylos carnosus TaxID=1234261 RepID=A0A815T3I2_9BILA|nr:unnamed protein product [Didymodactylos carnosus]CAF4363959.1 unnamed protein product [Didymodactylos carnosus]
MENCYNLNSLPQLTAVQYSFPYIKAAVDKHERARVETDGQEQSWTIADYGSSQGGNSLVAVQFIIEQLKQKYSLPNDCSFIVVYNDLPENDWSILFKTVAASMPAVNIYPLASGKSFYEQILPRDSLDFAFTSTSLHWMSRVPCTIKNHCFYQFANSDDYKLWKRQADDDYKAFLKCRSNELKQG